MEFSQVCFVVLMCMFRNNGLYALILLIPICFFCFKERRKATIILFMLSMLIYVSYQNILLPSLGVKSGNIREMMSIPCQQLAKVYVETPEAYTDEEKEALLELIPEKNIQMSWHQSDFITVLYWGLWWNNGRII